MQTYTRTSLLSTTLHMNIYPVPHFPLTFPPLSNGVGMNVKKYQPRNGWEITLEMVVSKFVVFICECVCVYLCVFVCGVSTAMQAHTRKSTPSSSHSSISNSSRSTLYERIRNARAREQASRNVMNLRFFFLFRFLSPPSAFLPPRSSSFFFCLCWVGAWVAIDDVMFLLFLVWFFFFFVFCSVSWIL